MAEQDSTFYIRLRGAVNYVILIPAFLFFIFLGLRGRSERVVAYATVRGCKGLCDEDLSTLSGVHDLLSCGTSLETTLRTTAALATCIQYSASDLSIAITAHIQAVTRDGHSE
jgi:hypothetical protein